MRLNLRQAGKGNSFVSSAVLLPTRVTHLVIKKPRNFDYQPGDYVFLNIPSIAKYEWHPFTISSAPEESGIEPLQIRPLNGMLVLRINL